MTHRPSISEFVTLPLDEYHFAPCANVAAKAKKNVFQKHDEKYMYCRNSHN